MVKLENIFLLKNCYSLASYFLKKTFKQDIKHKSQYHRTQTSQLISFSKADVTAHRPSPRTDGWPFKSKDTSKCLLSSLIMKY